MTARHVRTTGRSRTARSTRHRRTTALFGAAALGLTAAACGGSGGGASSDPKTLTVLSQYVKSTPGGKVFHEEAKAFTEETGIKVKVVEAGEDLDETYETSLTAGKEADIVFVNVYDKSLGWSKNGATVAATDYIEDWGLKDKVLPQALTEWTDSDGKLMGFPYAGFSWPVWYNTALLEKAGVEEIPATTDELIAAAKKLRAKGIAPMAVGGKDWSGQKVLSQVAQAYSSAAETRKLYARGGFCASADAMKGIELFVKLREAGVFIDKAQGFTFETMQSKFWNRQAAIMSQGSWALAEVPEKTAEQTVMAGLPIPSGSTFDKPTAFRGYTSTGFWISPNGDKKADSVKRFIQHFYQQEVAERFLDDASIITSVELDEKRRATDDDLLDQSLNDLPAKADFAQLPDLQIPAAANTPLVQATSLAFGEDADAKKICAAMDQAYSGVK
ncbi:ABC transporter substrate-binding protein [Streptomyces sp. NPDC054796]